MLAWRLRWNLGSRQGKWTLHLHLPYCSRFKMEAIYILYRVKRAAFLNRVWKCHSKLKVMTWENTGNWGLPARVSPNKHLACFKTSIWAMVTSSDAFRKCVMDFHFPLPTFFHRLSRWNVLSVCAAPSRCIGTFLPASLLVQTSFNTPVRYYRGKI